MSQTSRSPKSFTAGTDLEASVRVKISGATVIVAGDEERADGVTLKKVDSGEKVAVQLINAGGSFKMTAAGAIAQGARYYAAATGKIEATGTIAYGTTVEAAGAAGDVIEVLPD